MARKNTNLHAMKLIMACDLEQSNVSLAILDASQSDAFNKGKCDALDAENRDGAQVSLQYTCNPPGACSERIYF